MFGNISIGKLFFKVVVEIIKGNVKVENMGEKGFFSNLGNCIMI